ncbi:MAG: GNAT family N-acetyltransferase [Roseibium sp.]
MPDDILMETERLLLRQWCDEDLDPFADMGTDREVMRYFPNLMTRAKSANMIEIARARTNDGGFCFSPIELRETREFLGFVGLNRPAYRVPLPFDPCVEIGWRLKRSAWGNGYASEAALAWLRFGFETLDLDEIVSFTTQSNLASQKVMERIGMRRDRKGDFLHPELVPDHSLAPHVLYRRSRTGWVGASG